MEKKWIQSIGLNTLEQLFSRVFDALATLLLVSLFAPEHYALISLSTALVAGLLIIFASPTDATYLYWNRWKEKGEEKLKEKLSVNRIYGGIVFWISLGISIFLAFSVSLTEHSVSEHFYSYCRAFLLFNAVIMCGADREFLKMNLKLSLLSKITVIQKLILLVGTYFSLKTENPFFWLLLSAFFSFLFQWGALRVSLNKIYPFQTRIKKTLTERLEILKQHFQETVLKYTLWTHLSLYLWNFIQGLDLLFLRSHQTPERVIGVYSGALKLANFSLAIPIALCNGVLIYLGSDPKTGLKKSFYLYSFFCLIQAVLLILLSEYILELFFLNQWSMEEIHRYTGYFQIFCVASFFLALSFFFHHYSMMKFSVRKMLTSVYIPWSILSAGFYFVSVYYYDISVLVQSNVLVAFLLFALWLSFYRKQKYSK